MIKQQNAGALRSSRRRAGTGRAALMLSAGTLAMVLAQPALAQVAPDTLPSGGTIVGGTGSIDFASSDMTVTQTSDRLLINWGSFDIGSGATVQFDMDATDIAVNRDLSGNPSEIYGALSGDGMIMILNPNGVLFGSGANVNVGSLVATTAGLTDLNAMSGSVLNFSGAGGGAINIAAGANITVAEAGLAAFVAPSVANNGIITATGGHVFLGGAEGFTLDLANDGLLELTVPTASPLVQNHGDIFAAGGRIQMSAAAASALVGAVINVEGVLQVTSASSDDGVIVLEAAGNAIEVSADLAVEGNIDFVARRVFGAGDVDVDDGALTLNIDPDGADTTGETLIADALGVIGAVDGGTTLNLAAGDYAAGAVINAANVTVDGGGVARIIADQHGQDGLIVNGTGDGAVIQGLEFIGQADTSYNGFAWGSTITRGVVLRNGAENVTVTDNVITGVRNGILIDGRNDGSVITDNTIDNTKSAISVQYTDGSNLTLTGNDEGVFGNEWGINVHLNGVWNGSSISASAGSLGANPSAAAQQHLLDLSNANSGMSVYNQAYSASNRTHVHVDAGGSPTGQGAAPSPISTVHGGVAAVVNGGQVFVADGVYNFAGSRLIINKSLTLTGESEEGVILDGRSVGGGLGTVLVSADNVTLSNFTLYGADSGANNYGIKVQPNPTGYDPNQRIYNFSINDVTVRGSTRAELDLNGVVGATITNFTADGRRVSDDSHESGGAGVQITDSADITLTGVTTLGNAWGSVAIYQTNAAGAYNGLTDNINIDAGENTFNEFLGVFVQRYSTLHPEIGQLNLTGFNYAVRNTGHRANGDEFTFFRTDLDDATDFALGIAAADTSSIEGWSGTDYTNTFTVVDGLTIGAALRDVRTGGLINVGAGTFDETVSIATGLTLEGAGMDATFITGGIATSGAISDLTLAGFSVSGDGGSNTVIRNGGVITGLTVDGVRIDGESVASRFGFVGGQIGGDISITDSEFLNINGWAVFDTRSGAGANQGSQITSAVFSGNTLDNVQGHIAFRQDAVGAFPDVVFSNNTVTNVGNATNSFGAIFKAFNADVVTFSDNDVSDVGTSGFNPGGEAAYGAVLMVRGASQLNVTGNTFTNNHMVFAVEPNRGLPTATTFTGNTFSNNAYGVYMPGTALAGGSVTFGAGNNFVAGADTVQHIVWRSAGALDLTGVMFDGQLAADMSLADQLALEDLITHGVDRSGSGLATVVDGQIFVTEGSGSNALNRAVNLASSGDTVNVGDGDHVITSTVNVDESIAIVGQSRAGTFIDGTAIAGYGMEVNADDVTLANFTFQGNNASTNSGHYGIKVQPDTGDASDRVHDFTIQNVAIQGWGGSELDLNGVVGALIDGVIADGQGTKGVGIGLTDSADVTIVNSETLNNLWGSVALYQTNRFYDQQVDNITIDADLNSFGEALGVFSQSYSDIGLEIGDLNLTGFDFVVRNTGHRANGDEFTFFRTDLADATDFALSIAAANTSSIEGWSGTGYTNAFTVVDGLTIGAAIRDVRDGGFINVGAGTYGGFATAFGGPSDLTITGAAGAVIDGSGVTGRIVDLRADGTSLSGFTIQGDGGGVGVSVSGRGVTVSDNVIENVLTGVQTTTQYAAGDAAITGNTITADYGVSLQNTGNTVSGNTVNAAVEGVGLLYAANSFSGNTFTVAAGADALNYYGVATYVGLTASDNTVAIEGGGLQGALDLAGSGGSVNAGAATHNETVTIRHSLTLTGAGQGDTVINGGIVIAGHSPAGSSIDGLTIEGLTVNAGAGQVGLIALSNSVDGVYNTTNLTVTDVTLNGNGQHAVGLFDVNGATFDNVTINAAAGFNGVEAIGLNGFFMDGGAIHGALTGVNVWELAGYEANDGLVFLGVDFADNRTHLSLQGAGAVLDAILSANSFDRTIHATDGDAIYGDLAWAVSDAAAGSELNLSADTFTLTSALIIDRTMTLVGAGQGQTIIDASGASTYGIRVHADDVSLSDFTLSGGSGYGIKVEAAGSPTPDQRRTGFSIADVTIQNTGRTGLDLNAVIDAMIDGVTVTGVGNGNGISITDSAGVTVRNTTTSGNAWGGLALYQRNNIGGGGSDQQLTDIVIEDSNDFGEDTSVYVQVYNSALHDVGSLTVAGFDFVVQNDALDGGATSYVFFDRSLQDAIDRGVNLANASESVVGGWSGTGSDGNLYVGFGDLLGGGQAALSIQTAFDFSGDGDIINIAGGDYGQSAILDEARTVLFDDAGVGLTGLILTTDAAGSDLGGRVTASGDIDILGDIILHDDLSLTGAGVSLAGVDGSSVNGQTLSIEADAISLGAAGAATALNSLLLFGDATLAGAEYNAAGFLTTGSTILATDVSIEVDGALVMGAVDGEHALLIHADSATLGEAGAAEALATLDVIAASITTAGATTTGDQSYSGALTLSGDYAAGGVFSVNGATTLGGDVDVDASTITLGAVDGEHGLTLAADGSVNLGAVGADETLTSLTVSGVSIATGGAATTGAQSYAGALTLDGNYAAGGAFSVDGATTLGGDVDVEAGSIAFGAVDGEHDLTLAADGSVVLGAVGGGQALASLTASGSLIATSGAATTGAQAYTGALTLSGDYAAGGAFTVNGATTLGGDVTVDADAIALAAVDGEYGLTVNADGAISLGVVGANEALSSLTASGAAITTSGAATTGAQSYAGALTLDGDYAAGGAFSINGATTLGGATSIDAASIALASVDGEEDLVVAADGAVVLGAVGSDEALASLTASGATIATSGAATTGAQAYTGALTLDGDYAAGGAFSVDGATTLGGDVEIDAAAITLGAVDGEEDLVLSADGAVVLGAVGSTEALASLTASGAVITTAGAATTGGQSYSGATTLDGDYAAGGAFSVNGATTLGGATSVDAGSIALASVDGEEDLILTADGVVVLGGVGADEALASLTASGASITTAGAATTGAQAYTGAVSLNGDYAAGGAFSVNGAATLGGDVNVDASAITLGAVDGENDLTVAADGAVVLGAVGSTEALASLTVSGAAITTAGAATTGGQSYTGALTLEGDYVAGGAFSVNGATTLAGATSVDAASIALASVDGEEDLILAADGAISLGAVGADEALASLTASGASITTAGTATTGAQSYTGALTLDGDYAAGGAFSVNGATTLASDVQIMTQGGDVMLGLIDGAHGLTITAVSGNVTLGPVGSFVAVDDLIVSGGVVTTAGAASTGAQSWSGDQVRLSGSFTTRGGDFIVSGPAILNASTTITTSGGDASLDSVDGASAGGQAFRLNAGAGSVELGSLGALARLGATVVVANSTVLNGDTYAANSLSFMGAGADATVRLTELLTTFNTVQSADQAGAISIAPHLIGTVDGEQGVVFIAGTGGSAGDGDITLGDAGADDLRLGLMTATGGDFSAATVMLAGDFTSTLSGDQVFSDNTLDTLGDVNATVAGNERGPINAGGSVTLNVGGSSNGSITAGGPVNVTSGGNTNRNITSGGAVTLTSTGGSVGGSVSAAGPVTVNSAGTITGSYASSGVITLNAEQSIDVQVDGDVVRVDAPGGTVTGVFSEITTDETGTFVINGETVVGTGSADARQILIDGFIAPVGGVVGPTGLIQLPVGLALALISPAGEGEGQRPAVLVNDVDRLGELLRLGYTAIVIQMDESGLLIEEELILADTEQQQAAGVQ